MSQIGQLKTILKWKVKTERILSIVKTYSGSLKIYDEVLCLMTNDWIRFLVKIKKKKRKKFIGYFYRNLSDKAINVKKTWF